MNDDENEVSDDDDENQDDNSSLSDSVSEDSGGQCDVNWRVELLLQEEYIALCLTTSTLLIVNIML